HQQSGADRHAWPASQAVGGGRRARLVACRRAPPLPKNANVFFTIFQTFMTGEGEFTFQGYPPDFFDLIVIDECHRGGAKDESTWRGILEYFTPAVQLGLTATPKRDATGKSGRSD